MTTKEALAVVSEARDEARLRQAQVVLSRAGFRNLAATVFKHIEVLHAIAAAKALPPHVPKKRVLAKTTTREAV